MDRRQLLVGMAATGVAAQFGLGELAAHAGEVQADGIPSARKTRFYPPDGDRDFPRGPVKSCWEESSGYDRTVRTTTFDDGRAMTRRRTLTYY